MDTKLHVPMGCGVYPTREQLKKMLLEKQTAKINKSNRKETQTTITSGNSTLTKKK